LLYVCVCVFRGAQTAETDTFQNFVLSFVWKQSDSVDDPCWNSIDF